MAPVNLSLSVFHLLLLFSPLLLSLASAERLVFPNESLADAIITSRANGHREPLRLSPGIHYINQTITLTQRDRGFALIGSSADSTAVSGAFEVSQWQKSSLPGKALEIWSAPLPEDFTRVWRLYVAEASESATHSILSRSLKKQKQVGQGDTLPTFAPRTLARSDTMAYDHVSEVDPEHSIVYEPGQVLDTYSDMAAVTATLYHVSVRRKERERPSLDGASSTSLSSRPDLSLLTLAYCSPVAGH
jgi:hypothetical protein